MERNSSSIENDGSTDPRVVIECLEEIEERQIRENVGITVRGPALEGEEGQRFLEEFADEKHTTALAKLLRGKGSDAR